MSASQYSSHAVIPVVLPLLMAGIIVVTRTRDYYHNFSDVIAGSLIGMLSSVIVYFAKFESLTSPRSGEVRVPESSTDEAEGEELEDVHVEIN